MPYIRREFREVVDVLLKQKGSEFAPANVGELNYCFSMLAKRYIDIHGLSYQHINDVLGALDGASKEFYRRVAAPYENEKIKTNGDVYNLPE